MNGSMLGGALLCALLVGAVEPARAQGVSGGVRLGVARSSLLHEEEGGAGSRTGLAIGGFLAVRGGGPVGARLEAMFVQKGAADDDVTLALDYVEFPLLVQLTLGGGAVAPVLFAGPALGLKVGAAVKDDEESFDYGELVHGTDLGLTVGGGLALGRAVTVDARYTRGMRPVFDFDDPEDSDSDDANQSLSVGVAVTLF